DLATGKVVQVLGRDGPVNPPRLAYAPDGKTLASAGRDLLIRLWDTAKGKELRQFRGPKALRWARAYHCRSGRSPTCWSGKVPGSGGETWLGIDAALKRGQRGLPGGSSLSKLLADRGLKRNRRTRPELTHTKILRWADRHHDETGTWPKKTSGP